MSENDTRAEHPDVLTAAMAELAAGGWRRLSLSGVAARMGVTVAEVQAFMPTRWHLLRRLSRHLDRATFSISSGTLAELSVRDRLFELIMRRLDATRPFKDGVRRLAAEAKRDPALVLLSGSSLKRTAAVMLDVAEGQACRPGGQLAAHALAALYLRVLNVWLNDESEDEARTLAELDQRLGQAERVARFMQRCKPVSGGRSGRAEDVDVPSAGAEAPSGS